jgi:hypothetical protein
MKSTKELFDILRVTQFYSEEYTSRLSFLCLPLEVTTKNGNLTDVFFDINERTFYPESESKPAGSPFRFLNLGSGFGIDYMDLHGLNMIPLERAQIRIAVNQVIVFEHFFYRNDQGLLWCSPLQWLLLVGAKHTSIRVRFFDPDIRIDNLRLYITGIEIFDLNTINT